MYNNPIRFLYGILVLFLPLLSNAQVIQYNYHSSIGGLSNEILPQLFDVDNQNNVYILERKSQDSYSVKKFNSANMLISEVELITSSTSRLYFSQFRCSKDGYMLGFDDYSGIIYVFGQDGNAIEELHLYDNIEFIEHSFYEPIDMIVSDDNIIYILLNHGMAGLDFEGNVKTLWMFEEDFYANSLTIDKRGNLYVADYEYTVLVYTPQGTVTDTVSVYTPFLQSYITQIVSDGHDKLFVLYQASYMNYYAVYRTDGKVITSYENGHSYITESGDTIYVNFKVLGRMSFKNNRLYIADHQGNEDHPVFQFDRIAIFDQMKTEPFAIYGPDRIPVNTPVTYQILPKYENLSLYCRYTGTRVERIASIDEGSGSGYGNSDKITLLALDNATPGQLICSFESEKVEQDSIFLNITPYTPTRPYAVNPVNCDTKEEVYCGDGSIKSFNFSNLSKRNIDCRGYGYKDYTMDNLVANTNIGQLYSATISLNTDNPSLPYYAGIWIDLNNDGDFDDPDEFAGTSLAFDEVVKFINIRIPQYTDYTGDARLRVRSRAIAPFSADESCINKGDVGETQDYTIQIIQSVSLTATEVITPNNDGKNDHFVIRGIDNEYTNKLLITDSFGKKISQINDYRNDWPAQNDRSLLPSGTYYYFFENGPGSINGFFIVNY